MAKLKQFDIRYTMTVERIATISAKDKHDAHVKFNNGEKLLVEIEVDALNVEILTIEEAV